MIIQLDLMEIFFFLLTMILACQMFKRKKSTKLVFTAVPGWPMIVIILLCKNQK
jgi:hypothetical protein